MRAKDTPLFFKMLPAFPKKPTQLSGKKLPSLFYYSSHRSKFSELHCNCARFKTSWVNHWHFNSIEKILIKHKIKTK